MITDIARVRVDPWMVPSNSGRARAITDCVNGEGLGSEAKYSPLVKDLRRRSGMPGWNSQFWYIPGISGRVARYEKAHEKHSRHGVLQLSLRPG